MTLADRPSVAVLCFFALFFAVAAAVGIGAAPEPLAFGVINQRSIALTAEYWNPILEYVGKRSVPLRLKMGKTAVETTRMAVRGDFAFVYTNHLFTPERVRLGYKVIARPDGSGIRSEIAVLEESPARSVADLAGKSVAFPSREAVAGYWIPMDSLLRAGVTVIPAFGANQEGAMAQLRAGRVAAAAVNGSILQDYAHREKMRYRSIWRSETYPEIPIVANPSVPPEVVRAVRSALVGMWKDAEGRRVLEAGAALLNLRAPQGFVDATDAEYEPYRRFFERTLVKE